MEEVPIVTLRVHVAMLQEASPNYASCLRAVVPLCGADASAAPLLRLWSKQPAEWAIRAVGLVCKAAPTWAAECVRTLWRVRANASKEDDLSEWGSTAKAVVWAAAQLPEVEPLQRCRYGSALLHLGCEAEGRKLIFEAIREETKDVAKILRVQLEGVPHDEAAAALLARRAMAALSVCGHLESWGVWQAYTPTNPDEVYDTCDKWFSGVIREVREGVGALQENVSLSESGERVLSIVKRVVALACLARTGLVPENQYCIMLVGLPAMGCWVPRVEEEFRPSMKFVCEDEGFRRALENVTRLVECIFASCCSLQSLGRTGGIAAAAFRWCAIGSDGLSSDLQHAWQPRVVAGFPALASKFWERVHWKPQDLLRACVAQFKRPDSTEEGRVLAAAGTLAFLMPGCSSLCSSYNFKLDDAERRRLLHPMARTALQDVAGSKAVAVVLGRALEDILECGDVWHDLSRPTRFVEAACLAHSRTIVFLEPRVVAEGEGAESMRLRDLWASVQNQHNLYERKELQCANLFVKEVLPHLDALDILKRRMCVASLLRSHVVAYTCEIGLDEARQHFENKVASIRQDMLQDMQAAEVYRGVTRSGHERQLEEESSHWFLVASFPAKFRELPVVLRVLEQEIDTMKREQEHFVKLLNMALAEFKKEEKARDESLHAVTEARSKLQEARTGLVQAAEDGDLDAVQKYVEAFFLPWKREALVNSPDISGVPPLHAACGAGRRDVVEYLLGKGANPLKFDSNGWHAIHWAIRAPPERWRATCEAIKRVVKAETLWSPGSVDPSCDSAGKTPLHTAAFFGLVDQCRWLVSAGHPLKVFSTRTRNGKFYETPLFQATVQGRIAVLNGLLGDVPRGERLLVGMDLMVEAIVRRNAEVVRAFLDMGFAADQAVDQANAMAQELGLGEDELHDFLWKMSMRQNL